IRQKAIDAVVEKAKQSGKDVPTDADGAVVLDESTTSTTVSIPSSEESKPATNAKDSSDAAKPDANASEASSSDASKQNRGLFD
ncbi:MAG: hypothetical protein II415_06210, partial [Bacteroidaceae bacterium]|nr:hypothetical protein [Bacteroidaceae bacterium]